MTYSDQNHNRLAPRVYQDLAKRGVAMPSRNGPVLRLPGPVTLTSLRPRQRVSFCPVRDANPFFHLVEAMAMLAGHNSVRLLSFFARQMSAYSDDGERYNAFYGTRMRETWGDQLTAVIEHLRLDKDSRQAVVNLWDPADLNKPTKDKACNLMMLFSVREQQLDMTVFNRSNDAIWGTLSGANVVHLSFFQEYVACALGLAVGEWHTVTNNLHVYTHRKLGDQWVENGQWVMVLTAAGQPPVDFYGEEPGDIRPGPFLFRPGDEEARLEFDRELRGLVATWERMITGELHQLDRVLLNNEFLTGVAHPVFLSFALRRLGAREAIVRHELSRIQADDWRTACVAWVNRRADNGGAS